MVVAQGGPKEQMRDENSSGLSRPVGITLVLLKVQPPRPLQNQDLQRGRLMISNQFLHKIQMQKQISGGTHQFTNGWEGRWVKIDHGSP